MSGQVLVVLTDSGREALADIIDLLETSKSRENVALVCSDFEPAYPLMLATAIWKKDLQTEVRLWLQTQDVLFAVEFPRNASIGFLRVSRSPARRKQQ